MTTLPARLFCDTSFFYAALDPDDVHHERAATIVDEASAARCDFFTTWDIVSESVTLLRYRRSFAAALRFLDDVTPALRIVSYGDGVRREATEVFKLRARTHRFSFCDAISFVVVTTILDDMPCVAFDRDFRRLGLAVIR